ncbi:Fc.00g037390.m01.CDS01 [Cosmosporella sp. VM-42]
MVSALRWTATGNKAEIDSSDFLYMQALRILAEGGESPKVDSVVAVHGLNPKGKDVKQHAWDTWTKKSTNGDKLWLRDDLPGSLPEARIMLYEYNSQVFSKEHQTFLDAGDELLSPLRAKRRDDVRRPLILVGHSLGGLLIKQALVNAHNSHFSDIKKSVKGLVFFATPHAGGNIHSAKVKLGLTAAEIAQGLGFNSNDAVVEVLRPGSLFGDFLRESFRHQLDDYRILSFWGKSDKVVAKADSVFGLPGGHENQLGLDANHSDICKFDLTVEHDSDVYEVVQESFEWIYHDVLKGLQEDEEERDLVEKLAALQAPENLPELPSLNDGSHCETARKPSFMVPFGRNKGFVEGEYMLRTLLAKIVPSADKDDCQRIAIQGLGGIGKTQVVIEAAYQLRLGHPDCSVFWVSAINAAGFENSYREMGRKLGIRGIGDGHTDIQRTIQDAMEHVDFGDWLLIIDNADDPALLFGDEGLTNYLPFSLRSSILFTTRNHEVVTRLDISSDDTFQVQELSDGESLQFFEKTLKPKLLNSADTCTQRLIKFLANLPLALKQASAFMTAQEMSTSE